MEHVVDAERVHHGWNRALEPILTVDSGDVVHYDLRMAGHGQISEGDGSSARARPTWCAAWRET